MKILGISQDGHNSSAVLVKDGEIIFGALEERFNREKLTRQFPFGVLKEITKEHPWDTIDHVAVGWNALLNAASRRTGFQNRRWKPETLYQVPMKLEMASGLGGCDYVHQRIRYGCTDLSVYFLTHPKCHAASGIFTSGFDACSFVVMDAIGERLSSVSGYYTPETGIKVLTETPFPFSAGIVYGSVTEYLGLRFNADEWKVMALATIRPPTQRALRFRNKFREILKLRSDGVFDVDLRYFEYGLDQQRFYSDLMEEEFGPARSKCAGDDFDSHHIDVAYGVQKAFEDLTLDYVRFVVEATGHKNVVVSGGCFMNSVANGLLEHAIPGLDLYVGGMPADEGTALGGAFLLANEVLGERWSTPRLRTTAFGREFSDREVQETLAKYGQVFKVIPSDEVPSTTASRIAAGEVVGWFQGREEMGQRALGHRSILADPRDVKTKDIVNAKIKYRESYRPFAPSVLEEEASDWFYVSPGGSIPFMEKVVRTREDKAASIGAVVHFDGTARVQTVGRETNPLYHEMISCFYELTGVPMVLNTSFNLAGEPIVSSIEDALRTFNTSGLDALVIGNCILEKGHA